MIRIGVDLGGTKIEALALDQHGRELKRKRVATPKGDYQGTIKTIVELVTFLEENWRKGNRWNRHPWNSFSENRVGEKCQFHLADWEALQP